MGRRTVAVCLAVVLGALTACSAEREPVSAPPATGGASATATAGSPGASPGPTPSARPSVTRTGQVPVSPVPITPPAGTAPTRTFAVGTRKLTLDRGRTRPLPTRLWYPAVGSPGAGPAAGLEPAAGQFPIVLFSHGLTASPTDYSAMLSRWARAGFVVAAPAYPFTSHGVPTFSPLDVLNQPADASEVLTRVLALNRRPGDPLRGRIDPDRVAAAGHSAGGITTVGLFTGARDDRLDAGIVLAGRQLMAVPFTGPPAAMLFVHGRKDRTVGYAEGLAAFRAVPWSRAMLSVTRGGHLTRDRDFEVVVSTSTDFLRWSLYGDAAAKARIPADAARGSVATLIDDL
jgi:dienelactone hydrolase